MYRPRWVFEHLPGPLRAMPGDMGMEKKLANQGDIVNQVITWLTSAASTSLRP